MQPVLYQVEIDEAALRDLGKLPKQAKTQIFEKIELLASEPRPEGVEKLTKFKNYYRIRSGNYRVVYSIDDKGKVVIVAAVADRKQIYEVLDRRLT